MIGGEDVPLLLARLMRLSLAFTPLLLVLAAPSARALSVSALRLARLLGPLLTPELATVSLAKREPEDCAGPGLESVTSLAMLIAETCSASLQMSLSHRLQIPQREQARMQQQMTPSRIAEQQMTSSRIAE